MKKTAELPSPNFHITPTGGYLTYDVRFNSSQAPLTFRIFSGKEFRAWKQSAQKPRLYQLPPRTITPSKGYFTYDVRFNVSQAPHFLRIFKGKGFRAWKQYALKPKLYQ
ncbi:hypothetical protein AVEN_162147-1 [Araneus ventricosus]|uniref:Uncharacterized protein n=1 Tax=Araneus ventricosus TaxID=182803 RepID=A0A4Y2J4U7_ARAVE|nr:hypothetical protein AVEN_162147-1 [Araneus ventricosus]